MNSAVQCLLDAGVITTDQASALSKTIAFLPRGQELDALSAALLVSGMGASNDGGGDEGDNGSGGGEVISGNSSETIVSDNPTDVKQLSTGATRALVTPLTNNIIFTIDGSNPSATSGHFAAQGSNFIVSPDSFKFISFDSVGVSLYATYL